MEARFVRAYVDLYDPVRDQEEDTACRTAGVLRLVIVVLSSRRPGPFHDVSPDRCTRSWL